MRPAIRAASRAAHGRIVIKPPLWVRDVRASHPVSRGILAPLRHDPDRRRTGPSHHRLLAIGLVTLTVLVWIPTALRLGQPSADQIWEQFGIWSACIPDHFALGWAGAGSGSTGLGAFTGSLPAGAIVWLSCQLVHHTPLNGLQSFLAVGLALTFLLALIACRRAGFRDDTSLLTAFLITTAPCSFSRVGHLSLATLWPVIPGLLACHGLWRAMLPAAAPSAAPPARPGGWLALVGSGAIAAALCFPSQEYYVFFVLLLLACCYGLLLFLATTRTSRLAVLGSIAGRGLAFLAGVVVVIALAFLPKLMVAGSGGAPVAWATPRVAIEQFLYGLLPFTWLIPSPWVPMVSKALTDSGIPQNSESFFWSTGSFLIPIAWMTALWQLARPAPAAPSRELRFFALLLALVSAVGLLWMTMGGLGTLFAAVVNPSLRSLNRYTVFVYGASVLLLVRLFDEELGRRAARHSDGTCTEAEGPA